MDQHTSKKISSTKRIKRPRSRRGWASWLVGRLVGWLVGCGHVQIEWLWITYYSYTKYVLDLPPQDASGKRKFILIGIPYTKCNPGGIYIQIKNNIYPKRIPYTTEVLNMAPKPQRWLQDVISCLFSGASFWVYTQVLSGLEHSIPTCWVYKW